MFYDTMECFDAKIAIKFMSTGPFTGTYLAYLSTKMFFNDNFRTSNNMIFKFNIIVYKPG